MNVPLRRLAMLGFGCWLCYAAIAISARSLHEAGSGDHALLALLGFDYTKLTYRYAGRDFRLTGVCMANWSAGCWRKTGTPADDSDSQFLFPISKEGSAPTRLDLKSHHEFGEP